MVIAIELQAHGLTSDRPAPESFDQDADDVAELLAQLKITGADLLGFSNDPPGPPHAPRANRARS